MIVNPDKFQAIVFQEGHNNSNTNITSNIENIATNTSKSMKLLAITTDNKWNFEKHISVLCKNASLQLNEISRLQKYMGEKEKESIINSFIYSTIVPLFGIFVYVNPQIKLRKYRNVVLELC